jgi:hypothetical protein
MVPESLLDEDDGEVAGAAGGHMITEPWLRSARIPTQPPSTTSSISVDTQTSSTAQSPSLTILTYTSYYQASALTSCSEASGAQQGW